ncbi:hypothetical protein E5288_WYG014320 [Bos mutus]|uniref:RNA helicase n=1 Tax=Bos mutus TaxID=72004 RepID=A0A6B0S9K1_9CETA|nr:hypothetical protein [Bos mutus]
MIGHFKQSAEKLIVEKGALEALAAALAHISNATSCSIKMPNIIYAWVELKEQLDEDIDSKVKGIVFLKGKQGICFDIPNASVTEVQEKWHDLWHSQLYVATEQPELEGPWEGYYNF